MRLRPFILAVATTAALAGFASCKRPGSKSLYLATPGTSLSISFALPFGISSGTNLAFSDTCAGALSYLISVDLGSANLPVWDYRFLTDLSGNLYGCSAGACARNRIETFLGKPSRIMFEGLDVSASGYSSAPTVDVVCRGVADSVVSMGSITALPAPTPSPGAAPSEAVSLTVSVTIPLLRVGEFNPLFSKLTPSGGANSAASLSETTTRLPAGGVVALGGGNGGDATGDFRDIFEFRPASIGVFSGSTRLASPRAYAHAVAFVDSSGDPAFLFAGGDSGTQMEIYRSGAPATQLITSAYPPGELLGDIDVLPLPDHLEGATSAPAVLIWGGLNATNKPIDDYQLFFPVAPLNLTGCAPGAISGRAAACKRGAGSATGDGPHLFPVLTRVPDSPQVLIGFGNGLNFSQQTLAFLFNTDTFTSARLTTAGAGVFARTTVGRLGTNVGYFGHGPGTVLANAFGWGYLDPTSASLHIGSGQFRGALGSQEVPLGMQLADGRILFVGELDFAGVEVFVPVGSADGSFVYLKRPGSAMACSDGLAPACVRLLAPRDPLYSQVVRVEGTSTWLNESVLVLGGDALGPKPPELFVPSYGCLGDKPASADGSNELTSVDFCDRGRTPQQITNPEVPSRLP